MHWFITHNKTRNVFLNKVFLLSETQPTPDVYQSEVMDMLKEFTKNKDMEQRLDAPNLEYLDKSS